MSVGKQYEALVSERVSIDLNISGHVLTLQDRPIVKADEVRFRLSQGNLKIRRRKRFS